MLAAYAGQVQAVKELRHHGAKYDIHDRGEIFNLFPKPLPLPITIKSNTNDGPRIILADLAGPDLVRGEGQFIPPGWSLH